jgi:hypothetical protein
MHTEAFCLEQHVGRRRMFWTTHQEACGTYELCGHVCAIPGLVYEDIDAPYVDPRIYPPTGSSEADFRTIKTDEWLLGLILNILNTRARNDVGCPTPAAVFGHWSESYRDDGLYIGSLMWNAAEKSYIRIADAVKALVTAVKSDMGKLVAMELAQSVDVEGEYLGDNSVGITVLAHTVTGLRRLNLSGAFVSETWVWH